MRDPKSVLRFFLFAAIAMLALGQGRLTAQEAEAEAADDLDEIVGPIALYPDDLLRYVLPASTFYDQFPKAHAILERTGGKPKDDDPEVKELDDSVQALLPFPDIIKNFVEYPDWAQELGDAVATRQADVMKAIQAFRQKVHEAGNLETSEQQVIIVEKEVIRIEPAEPEVIYVPVYQPQTVVVKQTYPVLTFATGVAVGALIWGGNHWGHWGGCHWGNNTTININGGNWNARPGYQPRPPGQRPAQRPGGAGRAGTGRAGTTGAGRAGTTGAGRAGTTGAGRQGSAYQRPSAGKRPPSTARPPARPSAGTRPSQPSSSRPSARPSTSRPSNALGGSSRGSSARQDSARGARSSQRSRSTGGSRSRSGGSRGGGGGRRR